MQLIAITGMRYAPKVALVHELAARHAAAGARLALLDNSEKPIHLDMDNVQRSRFAGGCVCCTLAASLIPVVWRLEVDVALLLVSASADPEALARVLQTIQNTRVRAHTIALIDEHTREHFPYLAQRLIFYADEVRQV